MNARCLVICTVVLAILSPVVAASVMDFESHRPEPQNSASDSPEPNPSPRAAVTIQGQKDPRIELWLIAAYSTTNDACRARSFVGALSGAPKVPQVIYDSVRVPAGESHFSVQIYLDRYSPGRCGWAPLTIDRAEFLPEESRGPTAMSGLVLVRENGIDHTSLAFRCRRVSNIPGVEPSLFLRCYGERSSHDEAALSIGGGTVDLDMQLVPGPPDPVVPPKPGVNWPRVEHGT